MLRIHKPTALVSRCKGVSYAYGSTKYDLCVLGAGAAGFAGAVRGWDLGKKVVVVEQHKNKFGGASVWNGALSSKTMWQLARRSRGIKEFLKARGMSSDERISEIQNCATDASRAKSTQMERQLVALNESVKFRRAEPTRAAQSGTIDLQFGPAKFISPHCVEVTAEDGTVTQIEADYFLIATGSVPRQLPDIPVDGKRVITSDHIMEMDEWPKSMIVLGAGVLGCEFATIFQNFGQTQVHLVNQGKSRLLEGMEDRDLTDFITSKFEINGTRVHNNTGLVKATVREKGVLCTMGPRISGFGSHAKYQPEFAIQVDTLLLAMGRTPNVQNLGLEAAGVELTSRNCIKPDESGLRSLTVPHIFAAGDVTDDVGLVNVAEMEARCAVEMMFTPDNQVSELDYAHVSSILFLTPEVACVGMNETAAQRQGIPYTVATVGLDLTSRAMINFQRNPSRLTPEHPIDGRVGFVKMIVTNDDKKVLLGMRCAGREVSAIIETAALLIRDKKSVRELLRVLQPHPAITEAVQECTRLLLGYSVYKPHSFPDSYRVRSYSAAEAAENLKTKLDVDEGGHLTIEQIRTFCAKQGTHNADIDDFLGQLQAMRKVPADGKIHYSDFSDFIKKCPAAVVPSYLS